MSRKQSLEEVLGAGKGDEAAEAGLAVTVGVARVTGREKRAAAKLATMAAAYGEPKRLTDQARSEAL